MESFEERWKTIWAKQAEEQRRLTEDRVRIIITMINEPSLEDPADYMWLQVKVTKRLRKLMAEFQERYPLYRCCFEDAPPNFCPTYGPQLTVTESAIAVTTGHWTSTDWREDGIKRNWVEWALDDFVYELSGYHALTQWAQ